MPKRPRKREHGGGRERLYLVFDDWCHGYSIRKVNLLPGENHQRTAFSDQDDQDKVPHFPRPFFRMVAPRESPKYFTSAFGTRILAMHPRDPEGDLLEGYFPMLDVRSRCVTTGPGQRDLFYPIYHLPVGNKLFTMSFYSFEMLCLESFEMLCLEELSNKVSHRDSSKEWSWKELEQQPFNVCDVTSYSLHPEERTFLISTKEDTTEATYSFDTERHSWKLLGNWVLPFDGQGHFDQHLKAFVGLSKEPDTLGQIYCCDVPIYGTPEGRCPVPSMNLCKENLFISGDPMDKHVGATLVYMGGVSKFCLVQCVNKEVRVPGLSLPGSWMYRLTTFSLSLNDQRKELTTGDTCHSQYYKVPKATTKSLLVQDPVAFWM
ncbi:unnamed protein product [Triticum turgidum subsp. durum]|uniref:Uncharacterized protein n=1 Tax=Triticum turgidum subsp. durum TaxID=4567 RepID=A0A9R1PH61_TRITD|nr:unnamed protein product [Triticum turgidum subsp. durum]